MLINLRNDTTAYFHICQNLPLVLHDPEQLEQLTVTSSQLRDGCGKTRVTPNHPPSGNHHPKLRVLAPSQTSMPPMRLDRHASLGTAQFRNPPKGASRVAGPNHQLTGPNHVQESI